MLARAPVCEGGPVRPTYRRVPAAPVPVAVLAAALVMALAAGTAACGPKGSQVSDPPGTRQPSDPAGRAAAAVTGMSDVDLVGQVLVPSLDISAKPAASAALVAQYHLGAVILMGDVQTAAEAGSAASQVRATADAVQAAWRGL